jgi:hypothetical protein
MLKSALIGLSLVFTSMLPEGLAAVPPSNFEDFLKDDWQVLRARHPHDLSKPQSVAWVYRMTPPLPTAWPPTQHSGVAYYGYPYGFSMGLRDGEWIAQPWVKIEVSARGQPQKTLLQNEIRTLEVQGVRPLAAKEIQRFESSKSAPDDLANLQQLPPNTDPQAATIRGYYCSWIQTNGVIAQHLENTHTAFFAWLACDR